MLYSMVYLFNMVPILIDVIVIGIDITHDLTINTKKNIRINKLSYSPNKFI
jgi:hypothetical protein